jgi:hypothetical protein
MRLNSSALTLVLVALLPGCAPLPPAGTVPPVPAAAPGPGELWPGQRQAFFEDDPAEFLAATRAACAGPGLSTGRSGAEDFRCELLPTPEIAAMLILRYGGTVEALPVYVLSFTSEPSGEGYVVTADARVLVPRGDGSVLTLRFADPEVDADITAILTAAGGRPL